MSASSSKVPRYFLLGTVPTLLNKTINSPSLPTYRQVLLSFLAHADELRKPTIKIRREASKKTADMVMQFYIKANIPTIVHNKMCEKIEAHHKEMHDLMRIPKEERETGKGKRYERINKFKEDLNKTFVFWPRNVLEKISIEEDREFLINMMGPRTVTVGREDKKFAMTQEKKQKRIHVKAAQIEKEKERVSAQNTPLLTDVLTEDDTSNSEDTEDTSFTVTPKTTHKRVKTETTNV